MKRINRLFSNIGIVATGIALKALGEGLSQPLLYGPPESETIKEPVRQAWPYVLKVMAIPFIALVVIGIGVLTFIGINKKKNK